LTGDTSKLFTRAVFQPVSIIYLRAAAFTLLVFFFAWEMLAIGTKLVKTGPLKMDDDPASQTSPQKGKNFLGGS
jgi:hypothetical protein